MSHYIHPLLNTHGNKPSYIYIQNTGAPYTAKPTITITNSTHQWKTHVLDWAAGWVKVRVRRQSGPVATAAGTTTLDEITVTVTSGSTESMNVDVSYVDDPDVDPPKKGM